MFSRFSAGSSFWWNWNFETLEKNPRSKDWNQQQTQPTHDSGSELNGRFVLKEDGDLFFLIFLYELSSPS